MMSYSTQYLQCNVDEISTEAKSVSTAPSLTAAAFESKRRRVLLTGFAIFVAVLAPLAGLLLQIFAVHDYQRTSDSLLTSAPLGPTLAIAHACSTVAAASVPLVLGLEAYRLARAWLAASMVDGGNRPTPFQ